MAAKRATSLCLACQARQSLVGRRRPMAVKRRRLETLIEGAVGSDEAVEMTDAKAVRKMRTTDAIDQRLTSGVTMSAALPAWDPEQQPEDVQEALLSLEVLWKGRDQRIRLLRTLSNPWPPTQHGRQHRDRRPPSPLQLRLPEASAAPIPHDVFRHNLAHAVGDKAMRQVIRAQLLRCVVPRDIRRILALALTMNHRTRANIAALHEPVVRALYRCRARVHDSEVLSLLNGMRGRYQVYNIPFNTQLLALGLKFAARTRSLQDMKKYLKALSRNRSAVTSNVFRATIAKFSIGHRGLGEIRNGRWRRDELLQVLTGFNDCINIPAEQQYHLETFLDRTDWQYLHGWIAALARCKNTEAVWREWQLWKKNPERVRPKHLNVPSGRVTTKTRGDYWFIEQMSYSGGLEYAWRIVEETGANYLLLKDRIKTQLLEGLDFCPPAYWEVNRDAIRADLLRKCDTDLGKIERALSIAWVPTSIEDEGEGYHVLVLDQETVLEKLSGGDFKLEEDFGYPYDGIVPVKEMSLHAAAALDE
ncbi:hypothetical protein LTR62_000753 [Meristemomyces frigidus]|uniref:Uncharacterized protein n=1 Tax=Meristemomyces frigidus TaxID=1508187 RepID=A0AAN7TTA2_9PEZI|nr:hypothetical protein LTR62_000753 [Meristemomyces frigidus]